MELEFERENIVGYDTVAEVTLCQEETRESIVPDACPDILRIIDVCGQANLIGKQAQEGAAQVNGTVTASILYQPEEGGGLRRMEISLPFTCRADTPGLTAEGKVLACVQLRSAEARALNPRKVLLRADVAVEITACQPKELSLCSCVTEGQNEGICQRQYRGEHYYISDVQEKPFTLDEQIRLKQNQNGGAKLMACQVKPLCTESKIIGNKLIFKGSAEVALLLQESGGALISERESLPFSQIMEVAGSGEDNDCDVTVEVTQLTYEEIGEELELSLEMLAQAQVRCRRTVVLLQDLYSTACQTECKMEVRDLCRAGERTNIPQSVRELIETPDGVRSVVDSRLCLSDVRQSREGQDLVLSVDAKLAILYESEDQSIQCVRRSLPVSCRMECGEDVGCRCRCVCPSEVYAAPAAGGVEVRFNLEFRCVTWKRCRVPAVCAVDMGAPRERGSEGGPSVVLRLAAPGEELWDIAKAYGTTTEEIAQANELEGDVLPEGTMLLIPSIH